MHSYKNKSTNNSWNHTPSPAPNPFQPRPFGIQASSEQSPSTSLQEELDVLGERANPYSTNLLNIPIHAPGTEPPPPIQTSLQNSIQLKCEACEAEEKEPQIQTKLTVGAPRDTYEQEADRVAAQVMSMPDNAPQVQRFEEQQNQIQIRSDAPSITPVLQRQVDEQVQMLPLVQRVFQGGTNQADGNLESRLNASKGGGSPLAPEARAFMEPRFGADFSGVRVHTDSTAIQMSRELGAQAFTHGSDVYFGAGKSPGNNELTAHELTHVVQQTGMVQRQTTTPGGDPDCPNLLQEIRRFLFGDGSTKGLIQRWRELREDPLGLQWDYWSTPHPDGHGSVEGHQQQFRNMQRGLRNRLNQWNNKNCDDPDGPSQLPQNAWDWATRPAPAPIPRQRPVPASSRSVSVSDVINVLVTLGLSIALVAVVIAALADPEPASKLALAGLSAGMITILLTRLGIQSDSGGSTA